MTASPKRRRNHTIAAALSGVLVLGAAPVLGYLGWQVLQDSKAGTAVATLDEVAFPSTPTAMVAIVDDQGLITSIAVMVLAPKGAGESAAKGGTLVVLPVNASTAQTLSDDELPLADSLINGGEAATVAAVESLMRVTINHHAILDEAGATALFSPVGTIPVSLPNDVVTATGTGDTETLFVAGAAELEPSDAAGVLLARVPDEREALRLPNVRAVWNGFAEGVGAGIDPAAATSAAPADFNTFMQQLTAGPVQVFNDLATTPITGQENPDRLDVGRLDVASVVLLMAGLAPSAMIAPYPTINFRIENAVTAADIEQAGLQNITPVDVTKDLVSRLLFLQGNIISVSPEIFTADDPVVPDTTTVFTTGNFDSTELEVFTTALGDVRFVDPSFQFPLVDVVIVIGRSYLADMAAKQKSAPTTAPEPTATDPTDTSDSTGSSESADTESS